MDEHDETMEDRDRRFHVAILSLSGSLSSRGVRRQSTYFIPVDASLLTHPTGAMEKGKGCPVKVA